MVIDPLGSDTRFGQYDSMTPVQGSGREGRAPIFPEAGTMPFSSLFCVYFFKFRVVGSRGFIPIYSHLCDTRESESPVLSIK